MQPEIPGDEGSPAPTSGAAGSPSPAAADPPTVPRRRRSGGGLRLGLTLAALILGLAGLAATASGVASQLLPRRFSESQQLQIMSWETAGRWRTMPAGKIFPDTVAYQLPGYLLASAAGLPLTAQRLGIARQATCAAAATALVAQVLARVGCATVLRATYADATQSLVVTVVVAVLPTTAAAAAAARELPHGSLLSQGLRAAAFPGTLAAMFGNRQRQLSWAVSSGPYLVMSVGGYADGRPRVQVSSDSYAADEMTSLANGVAEAVGAPLGALPGPPQCPGAPGC